jgi:stress-induced morphogen
MAISKNELEEILLHNFPEAKIDLVDLAGDEDHYSLIIEHEFFKEKSIIEQHKLVKLALKGILDSKLHAITIKTKAI